MAIVFYSTNKDASETEWSDYLLQFLNVEGLLRKEIIRVEDVLYAAHLFLTLV